MKKKLESYLDTEVKSKDFIYIMKKDDKLFFRTNNSEYKLMKRIVLILNLYLSGYIL